MHVTIDNDLDSESDHLPINITINREWLAAAKVKRRMWDKTNVPILQQTVKDELSKINEGARLESRDDIDTLVSSIVHALEVGVEASTPWANSSPRSVPGFSEQCKVTCTEVQQLRRRWQRSRLDEDYECYRQARNRKGY